MADAGEYQQYHNVEPIFNGSYVRLPFFKDNVCPRTFDSFFGDSGNDNSQLVGLIITTTPTGHVKINRSCTPHP